jgi:hypothetical protein
LEELEEVIKEAGVTTIVYRSSKASIPTGTGPFLQLRQTGGTGPLRTHDRVGSAYRRPTAQVMARGGSFTTTDAMIHAAYAALEKVRNRTILGTWYQEIIMMSDIGDLGNDDTDARIRLVFNVMAVKRPS